jgi:hypothetical protein
VPLISNRELRIELLDPVADRRRLGPRFCWGGFIWQVTDLRSGPLLTGPEWPKPDPTAWNGQGLPESFRHRTRDGLPHTWSGDRGVALGAGELAVNAAGEVEVTQPCEWTVTPGETQIHFHTRQQAAGFDYSLSRKIELIGRTLISTSELTNHGTAPLTLEWFAHPFFALTDCLIQATLPEGTTLAENPGLAVTGRELTQNRRFDGNRGHMDSIKLPLGENLVARFSHPQLTHVDFETSFAPDECVIWGNGNTFSIEPYQMLSLASGQTKQWSLRYNFGPARVSSGT